VNLANIEFQFFGIDFKIILCLYINQKQAVVQKGSYLLLNSQVLQKSILHSSLKTSIQFETKGNM